MTILDEALAKQKFGDAWAVKRGHNPQWPYVPVIKNLNGMKDKTQQLRGVAFVTRDEALAYAQRHLDALMTQARAKFLDPGYRAFRAQFGLPRELADLLAAIAADTNT